MTGEELKARLRPAVRRGMDAFGVPPGVRPHLQDRLMRAGLARVQALRRGGRMFCGTEVLWLKAGSADVGLLEVPPPATGQVLVRADLTAVSPGTERALLNLLPGVMVKFPLRPGYSGVGTVVEAGRQMHDLAPGTRVVCTETMHHASISLVDGSRVFVLPEGAIDEEAAFLQLLIIAQHGLRRGRLRADERVAVVGAGLIGQLAVQVARAWGASSVTAVALSSSKAEVARRSGATDFVDVSRNTAVLDDLGCDLVVEVSGSPEALPIAARCTRAGGRIVLLGSTRGVNRGLDFDDLLRDRELSLIGAHISGLPVGEPRSGQASYGDEAAEALALLAERRLDVRALITDRVDPRDAGLFYRRLCRGERGIVGAILDWQRLTDDERCRKTFVLAPPRDLLRRGRSYDQDEGAPSVLRRPPGWLVAGLDALPAARGVVRFALIGCGGMGARHAAAIRSAPNTELVATMDVNPNLARELAGGSFHTTNLDEILTRRDVDAVLIATPNHLHEAMGVRAATAAKHIVMEKPMARDLRGADTLLEAARQAGVTLSVGYSFRYAPEIRLARRLVEAGLLGRLFTAQLSCYLDKTPAYYGSGKTNRTHSDWRASRAASGGGVLVMNMSHQLDQLRYILGQDAVRVQSAVAPGMDVPSGVDVEDLVSACCEFPDGVLAHLFGACIARGIENLVDLKILGEAGTLVLDHAPRFVTMRATSGITPGRWYAFGALPKVDVHMTYLAWTADAILAGREPEIDGQAGRSLQAWMEAIYDSARTQRPADLAGASGQVLRASRAGA